MITRASDSLMLLYETIKVFHDKGKSIPLEALPRLLKVVRTATELALQGEEELAIAERLLKFQGGGRRELPDDIDQDGNVVRLPVQPRAPRVVNPEGGAA